ncbi:MBL fold metallo-hydrolase [Planctomonas sp. JC2975]|uniref:MBL fold metallo-hydrolase n=1 Tax=Planctomonas sp. JC2975 TaxID=2729626 RepID=UPI001472BF15|nr:MBL fold metallo-hydrolase [Planctomonas sp. JC2975]NNC12065.1 MBL fold metallo-hydrolase [Planctomonas sp. JC2975]
MTIAVTQPWPPEPDSARGVAPAVEHLLAPNASSWTYEGTNSYVIANGGASVLIDPGILDETHLEALRRTGRANGREVASVLLTHDHPDHSDGARALADSLGVPILCMSPRFADDYLAGGQVLDVDGLDVHVIHTPGHSDDSVCLWMPDSGTLLTGDTVLGARSSGVMGKLGDLLTSLELLRNLAADRDVLALPGHGPAFTDLVASATKVIDVRTRRINELRGYIADGDTTLLTLIKRLYPDLTGSRAMFGASTVISTVEYLAGLDGEHGIADPDQREQILADIEKYNQQLAAHAKERAAAAAAH